LLGFLVLGKGGEEVANEGIPKEKLKKNKAKVRGMKSKKKRKKCPRKT